MVFIWSMVRGFLDTQNQELTFKQRFELNVLTCILIVDICAVKIDTSFCIH